MPSVGEIKRAVRERDGRRCTKCGLSSGDHFALTGRQLDVHRVVPGSAYTVEGCVALCRRCHGPMPKSRRGGQVEGARPVSFYASAGLLARLERVASGFGISMRSLVRMTLAEHLGDYEARLADRPQKPKPE